MASLVSSQLSRTEIPHEQCARGPGRGEEGRARRLSAERSQGRLVGPSLCCGKRQQQQQRGVVRCHWRAEEQRVGMQRHRLSSSAATQAWAGIARCALSSSAEALPEGPLSVPAPESSSSSSNLGPSLSPSNKAAGTLLGAAVAVVVAITAVCAVAFAPTGGAAGSLVEAFSKSGFAAAFSLIFVSEIGDKTFFIAALLAMRHSRSIVLAGAVTALGLMSVISAVIGRLFREVPAQLKTTVPVGEYLACALLVWFGVSSIRSALATQPAPPPSAGQHSTTGDESEELAEAREYVEQAAAKKSANTPLAVFWETFCLIFLAEWGDRSMLATIALGAAQSPVGVALGATWGHLLATGIAVVGGAFLSQHISEQTVGVVSGLLFLAFAAATLLGYF